MKSYFNPKEFFEETNGLDYFEEELDNGSDMATALGVAIGKTVNHDGDDSDEGYCSYLYDTAKQVINGDYDTISDVQEEVDELDEENKENEPEKTFVFHYTGDSSTKLSDGYAEEGWKESNGNKKYVEDDGFTCEAKNEKEAWNVFLSTDGKFGIPEHSNYDIEEK